jgi:hypothetical protein
MPTHELPEDDWHTFVYVHFSWLACGQCQLKPDLEWAWEGIEAKGEEAVRLFTIRTVEQLKKAGWVMYNDEPCCPACAARLVISD